LKGGLSSRFKTIRLKVMINSPRKKMNLKYVKSGGRERYNVHTDATESFDRGFRLSSGLISDTMGRKSAESKNRRVFRLVLEGGELTRKKI